MIPADPTQIQAEAERALRRGELARAAQLYGELAQRYPHDAALAAKVEQIQSMLHPAELGPGRARPPEAPIVPTSPEGEAERLVAQGDVIGAIAAYRQLLSERPHSELIQDRLAELFELARQNGLRPGETAAAQRKEPAQMLQGLLERIQARRRG